MRPGTRRALLGVASVSAVLVPALGMIYLGVVSYSSDRGAVAAKLEEQQHMTQKVARVVERELEAALSAAEERLRGPGGPSASDLRALRTALPEGARAFSVAPTGSLVWPRPQPFDAGMPELITSLTRRCPDTDFDRCVREIRQARRRSRTLFEAQTAELGACRGERCRATPGELGRARRLYARVASSADTGPEALLGLARVERAAGKRARAETHYRRLGERFGSRQSEEGVSYALLADLGRAELDEHVPGYLSVFRGLVEGDYPGRSDVVLALAAQVRERLDDRDLDAGEVARLATLDAALAAIEEEVAFARTLVPEVADLVRLATPVARGRAALDGSAHTVIVRQSEGGYTVGLIVPVRAIGAMAARIARDSGELHGTRSVRAHRIGQPPDSAETRTLATASFGPILPNTELSLVNARSEPDPLDEIVREQGRRHLWISGGLALVLVIGIIATIRNAARERELARLKSDFVSTVSHELKTPLTSVRMFAEMLQEGVARGDSDRESRYHDIIVKESERLSLLIANLLDYSQVERGTRRYSEHLTSLDAIASEAVATFARFREGQGPAIEIERSRVPEQSVRVDREVVVQCVLNLLSNAIKYAGDAEPITVSVACDGGEGRITVRDRGPGVPRAEMKSIWEEFYRSPSAYISGIEGTGLGLALVKRHVVAQGGRVEVSNVHGGGAAFTIALPLVLAPESSEEVSA